MKKYLKFKSEFATLCREYGAVEAPNHAIGDGAAFVLETAYGPLSISIHAPYPGERRSNNHIQSIFLRWLDYRGPVPWTHDDSFNKFSHKWNICVGGADRDSAEFFAVAALARRLKFVNELGVAA